MTALVQVGTNLAGQLQTRCGLGAYVPGQAPPFPALFVPPPSIPEPPDDLAFANFTALYEVAILVAPEPVQLPVLMSFIDPRSDKSVWQAVQADRTLGGLNVDAHVGATRGLSAEEAAGYDAWGQAVTVIVFVS